MRPSDDYKRTRVSQAKELPRGLDAAVWRMAGRVQRSAWMQKRLVRESYQVAEAARALEKVGSDEISARLTRLQVSFRRKPAGDAALIREGLSLVAEIARRELGLRPHRVQLLGALVQLRGGLAEMATGEGKTLTVALAAVVAGWSRQPCHVITANDYLAERDMEWLRPFFAKCGLSAGHVIGGMDDNARRAGYDCDVTYTTSKELLADFLRDRLRLGTSIDGARRHLRFMLAPERAAQLGLVLRGIHTAFVDEADNILIDEAVTPLIISRHQPNAPLLQACRAAHRIACTFVPVHDYRIDHTHREIILSRRGWDKLLADDGGDTPILASPSWRADLVLQALKAREFFTRDRQYVVEDGKVMIIDESTGRLMPQRSWRQGLHQAIEAKEGIEVTDPTETLAKMSFQRFFRLFDRLAGLTGTASEAAGEFWFVYRLPVVRIPTHRPVIRQEWPDRIFANSETKWRAVADEVARVHKTGRPVLVGTRSVEASERLAALLAEDGLKCRVLNAVRHRDEATIIADAGERGRITVATNMAGRGTDIRLSQEVLALGGLHVIATERHETRRIDRQLFGRAGRQGDPGSAQAFVSMEDDLLVRFVPGPVRKTLQTLLTQRAPGAAWMAERAIARAQRAAQSLAARQRQGVVQADSWADDALSFAGTVE